MKKLHQFPLYARVAAVVAVMVVFGSMLLRFQVGILELLTLAALGALLIVVLFRKGP